MTSCLLPLLIAAFGGFLFFGIAQTDVSGPSEPAISVNEVFVSTPSTANVEAYILAAAAGDIETARPYVCDTNASELLEGITEDYIIDTNGLLCSAEGDNIVTCSFRSDLGVLDDVADIEMSFAVDANGLVCDLVGVSTDGEAVPLD